MSEELKVGDVVQLNSGGPVMTISAIGEDSATCVWFDKAKKFEDGFPLALLKKFQRAAIGASSIRRR